MYLLKWWKNLPPQEGKYLGVGVCIYEGWNFSSGNYLFTTDTK